MKRLLITTLVVLLGAGCELPPDPPEWEAQKNQPGHYMPVGGAKPGRVEVTRIDAIKDNLAYGDWRGIYLIKDTVTGQEFLGISGIGISELGHHTSGKTQRVDER